MKLRIKIGRWILFVILAVVLYFSTTGDSGFIALYRSHRTTRQMAKEIVTLNATIDSLRTSIRRLKNDTTYIERIAREKLGMAGKDEKVYKFIEE